MAKQNKPAIRFKGFTDAWEQRKVGELLIERNEQAPMNEEYPLMAFIANEGVAPKGERYDRSSLVTDTENKLYKRTEFGDFIYSSNNLETGSIGLNKYGKACISPVYSVFHPTGIADSNFLGRRLVRKDFINSMVKWRQGVIYGQWRIHESDFLKIEISVPSVKEQRQIGTFLDYLDNLITLHQRKYDKLTNVKKSMLEKMFPKNGSNVPEIRFKGFSDAWEQRKLDTITDVRDGTHDSPQYVETGHPFITSKNVKDGFINYEDIQYVSDKDYEEINKRSKVDKNDILMGMIGTIGNIALVRETPDFAIKNVALIKDIGDVHYRYLYHCLQSNSVAHQLDENLDGGTQKFIALNKIRELVIPVPSEHEQHKIGDYMESLDNLITLHQRELEKLKNLKKACLEKMFV